MIKRYISYNQAKNRNFYKFWANYSLKVINTKILLFYSRNFI